MNAIILSVVLTFLMLKTVMAITTHYKCRGGVYPRSSVSRFPVPDDKVDWNIPYEAYKPSNYTSPSVIGKPWADLDIGDAKFNPRWNTLDRNVNRESHLGQYNIKEGYPINPVGRTGLKGRGILGKWGPNHAADPVVTKWKRAQSGDQIVNSTSNKPILQFVCVKRRDNGEWALPGGMVDPGEKVAATALREFQEEATNSLLKTEVEKANWNKKFKSFFEIGSVVYKGYVDDPRNTDNAWMETVAYNFHDDDGSIVGDMQLNAGDDAVGVQWVDASEDLKLYASHKDIIESVVKNRNAHW